MYRRGKLSSSPGTKLQFDRVGTYICGMRWAAQAIRSNLRLRVFVPVLIAALAATWYGLFWSVDVFVGLTDGDRFPDMQPWLTAPELLGQVQKYGSETRSFYLWWSLFDYAWPFLTYTAMLFITAWLFTFLPASSQRWFVVLVGVAYFTVLMDWAENLGFATLVVGPPSEPTWIARLTLLAHAAKLLSNLLFNLGFLSALVAAAVIGLRARLA